MQGQQFGKLAAMATAFGMLGTAIDALVGQ
jgi:hypothetical protein